MCGICGELRFNNTEITNVRIQDMLESIASRGPDNTGQYKDCLLYTSPRQRDT